MELSKKIKENRIRKNLTQDDLADACYVTRSAVANWEAGRRRPDWENLIVLAKVLDLSVEELLDNDKNHYNDDNKSAVTLKNGVRLSFIVPIITTCTALVIIISLLLILLPKFIADDETFYKINVSDIEYVGLQIENDIYYFEEISKENFETEDYSNNSREFEIKRFNISEEYFEKYQFTTRNIFFFDIKFFYNGTWYLLTDNKYNYFALDTTDNAILFSSTRHQPYITNPGIYDIYILFEKDECYIAAYLKNK